MPFSDGAGHARERVITERGEGRCERITGYRAGGRPCPGRFLMSSRPNGSAAYWVRLNISAPERASAHVSVLVLLARSASSKGFALAARSTQLGT